MYRQGNNGIYRDKQVSLVLKKEQVMWVADERQKTTWPGAHITKNRSQYKEHQIPEPKITRVSSSSRQLGRKGKAVLWGPCWSNSEQFRLNSIIIFRFPMTGMSASEISCAIKALFLRDFGWTVTSHAKRFKVKMNNLSENSPENSNI